MADLVATTALNPMVDWFTGTASPAAAATRYLSIWNGDPQGAGTEVTNTITGSANRIAITANMGAASGGVSASTGTITITSDAAAGGTITHVGVHSAQTGTGNLMGSKGVTSRTVAQHDSLSIAAGNLTITLT